jgi:hypothetical protein
MIKNEKAKLDLFGITGVTVSGYKSISQEQTIEIRPLTILAGANSSGKSSIMQPLLLLKQTLEARYDPGPLLLDGPNVKFTAFDQLLSKSSKGKTLDSFAVGTHLRYQTELYDNEGNVTYEPIKASLTNSFKKQFPSGFAIKEMAYFDDNLASLVTLRPEMKDSEIIAMYPQNLRKFLEKEAGRESSQKLLIGQDRFYLFAKVNTVNIGSLIDMPIGLWSGEFPFAQEYFSLEIGRIIHLPGLRGNPERTYPVTAVGMTYEGTFENYVASIITRWQLDGKKDKLEQLSSDLSKLGLAKKIKATRVNDTQVELQVGRLTHPKQGQSRDFINIADVGLGVSQTLPILVALHTATPNQLVYLEQPEIHLHPRAQTAMAEVLADAAKRGVRIVAETHSSLLLLGIQTLIAEGKLSPDLVKLHWFSRDENGATSIRSADLDESGAFGDWPEDFDDVTLDAQSRYLDAAESRQQRIH